MRYHFLEELRKYPEELNLGYLVTNCKDPSSFVRCDIPPEAKKDVVRLPGKDLEEAHAEYWSTSFRAFVHQLGAKLSLSTNRHSKTISSKVTTHRFNNVGLYVKDMLSSPAVFELFKKMVDLEEESSTLGRLKLWCGVKVWMVVALQTVENARVESELNWGTSATAGIAVSPSAVLSGGIVPNTGLDDVGATVEGSAETVASDKRQMVGKHVFAVRYARLHYEISDGTLQRVRVSKPETYADQEDWEISWEELKDAIGEGSIVVEVQDDDDDWGAGEVTIGQGVLEGDEYMARVDDEEPL
jgi:hypothetical protein